MIKYLIITAILLLSPKALAVHVHSTTYGLEFETSKVAYIQGSVDPDSLRSFTHQMKETQLIKGDRVIIIDSSGGDENSGRKMIELIEWEKARGVRVIGIVDHRAMSMGFNILTHCNVRLAVYESQLLFHVVAFSAIGESQAKSGRLTPKELMKLAKELTRSDQLYRLENAQALHLSLSEYDLFADKDRCWDTTTLFQMGYLQGFARYEK